MKREWSTEDQQAAGEGDALRRAFRSSRGKSYNGRDTRSPRPVSLKEMLKPVKV